MSRFIDWVKRNKLATALLIAVLYFLLRDSLEGPFVGLGSNREMAMSVGSSMAKMLPRAGGGLSMGSDVIPPSPDFEAPPTDQQNRLVIRDTSLSIVVKSVSDAITAIQRGAEGFGGYLVSSHLSKPEESASGSIIVRVSEEKLSEALAMFRSVGLRVVDEQVSGRDVTDQYVDLEARLATLNKTKVKFEEILDRATQVQDLLNVQRELINLQQEIDSIKGQQQYLSQSAKLSKITVYLSTDEFSLPYAPAELWRPSVVLKLAVRSLVANLRNIGTAFIWIGVYAPIWAPVLIVIWILKRRKRRA